MKGSSVTGVELPTVRADTANGGGGHLITITLRQFKYVLLMKKVAEVDDLP